MDLNYKFGVNLIKNRGSVVYSVLSGLDAIELVKDKQTFFKNLLFGFRKP